MQDGRAENAPMMLLLALVAPCRACDLPTRASAPTGPDGAAWVLTSSPTEVCLFRVDDHGDGARVARWDATSPRAPSLVAPMIDGSVLLARAAPHGDGTWRLVLRRGAEELLLPLGLPCPPRALSADALTPIATVVTEDGRLWRIESTRSDADGSAEPQTVRTTARHGQ